jgi:cobaltochelatase CobT
MAEQAEWKDHLAATARALAVDDRLTVATGANYIEDPLRATEKIQLFGEAEGLSSAQERAAMRGQCDRTAMVKKFHSKAQHSRLLAVAPGHENWLQEMELARVDCCAARRYDGIAANLSDWSAKQAELSPPQMDESGRAPAEYAIAALLREKLGGLKVPKQQERWVSDWRAKMEPLLRQHYEALREALHDQPLFHRRLQETLLPEISALAGEGAGESDAPSEEMLEDNATSAQPDAQEDEQAAEEQGGESPQGDQLDQLEKRVEDQPTQKIQEVLQEAAGESFGSNEVEAAFRYPYHVYTNHYDEVISASKLASVEELQRLQQELDEKMPQLQQVTRKLANRLQRLLLARVERLWQFELEEGLLNNHRLPQAIMSPGFPYLYKQEQQSHQRETVVSLLLDNSGSMRGRPITITALSADLLARTLERCGVKVEILGFTTKEWRGGDSFKQWRGEGKAPQPGRLNDLRHIIYKSAEQPLARTRRNLALMLKEGLLKENIDGEALLWAYERLMKRTEQRKILMVISDGAPVDDATLSHNSGDYLDRHLREVIEKIEQKSPVELLAIGIGHDVSRYYRQATMIDEVDRLGEVMLGEVTKLFAKTA